MEVAALPSHRLKEHQCEQTKLRRAYPRTTLWVAKALGTVQILVNRKLPMMIELSNGSVEGRLYYAVVMYYIQLTC